MKLIDLVKDQQVHFQYFRDYEMWYKTDNGFLFPVPVKDPKEIGTATFNRDDKAILFMRYIRKYKEEMDEEAKQILIEKWKAKDVIDINSIEKVKDNLAIIIESQENGKSV